MTNSQQLPSELTEPPPRSLPSWARGRTYLLLLTAASVVLALATVPVAIEGGAAAVIPAGLAIIIAGTLVVQVQKRRLLSFGTGVVGRIIGANNAKGMLGLAYEYPTPAGAMRGSTGVDLMLVRRAFGFVPGENDVVFVVFDPARPSSSAIWGFPKQ
jgi:hypothetical protein